MQSISRETAAIIIDTRDHGESDKIITLLSPDKGKFTGIAKGASRSKKRFLNKLELFTYLKVTYSEKPHSTLALILDAELKSSHIHLRTSFLHYTSASLLREILLIGIPERQTDREIFVLLLWSLQSLDEGRNHLGVTAIFLLRFFDNIGYCPDFSCCRSCNAEFTTGRDYFFHHSTGGVVCSGCMAHINDGVSRLSPGTIRLLHAVLTEPLERLNRLRFSKQALQQSLVMLHRFGRNLFQREIQSWKTLRKSL